MPTLTETKKETRDGSSFSKWKACRTSQTLPSPKLGEESTPPTHEASSPDAKVTDNARNGFHKPVSFMLIRAELLYVLLHLYMEYKDLQH